MRRIAVAGVLIILVTGAATLYYGPEKTWQAIVALVRGSDQTIDPTKGKFTGTLAVEFFSAKVADGTAEVIFLLRPFGYVDSKSVAWNVPAGFISDGASIPNYLWAIVGGPYSGPYRDAAVVHDFYCRERTRPWEDVHLVFLEAALNRGTAVSLAKALYAGVLLDGPRWGKSRRADVPGAGVRRAQLVPVQSTTPAPSRPSESDRKAFEDLKAWIERERPTLQEIRKRVEEVRKAQRK